MDSFTALGPAEAHIVSQITDAIGKSKDEAHKLITALDEIDLDGVSVAMLDSDKRKSVIAMVSPIEGLVKSLTMNQMIPMIAKVLLDPKTDDQPAS